MALERGLMKFYDKILHNILNIWWICVYVWVSYMHYKCYKKSGEWLSSEQEEKAQSAQTHTYYSDNVGGSSSSWIEFERTNEKSEIDGG